MIRCFKTLYKIHPLSLLYCIAIPILTYNNFIPGNADFDTQFYLSAIENISKEKIDCLRTPVYPLFLKLCSVKGGDNLVFFVTIVQSFVFLISIFFFFSTAKKIFNSTNIAKLITLLYILSPVPNWCSMILTESLSISGMVIIMYYIVLFIEKTSWKLGLLISIILLLLIFLRPTFIIFLVITPVIFLLNCLFLKNYKFKKLYFSLLVVVIPLCCYLLYCKEYEKEYGIFTSSFKAPVYQLKRGEMWNEQFLTNKDDLETFHAIDTLFDGSYNFIYPMVDKNSKNISKVYHLCKSLKTEQQHKYIMYQLLLFSQSCDSSFPIWEYNRRTTLGRPLFFIYKLFSIHLSIVYLLTIIWTIILCYNFIRKKYYWTYSLIVSVCLCYSIGIGVFASEAFGRLMLPIYPVFLFLLGLTFDQLVIVLRKNI